VPAGGDVRERLPLVIDHLSLKTRIGDIWLGCTPRGVFWVNLGPIDVRAVDGFFGDREGVVFRKGGRLVEQAARELLRYLEGQQKRFTVKLDLRGSSSFSRKVWRVTRKIPYGQVRPYRWIADKLGDPNAARAVGGAMARNPVPIFIPCHRVVGSHGGLGGFGGGIGMKKWLLNLESGQPSLRLDAQGVEEA
jgi:methylated-DNA-[protein]-cysteine S-methyltransferase